jgi:hypothetical protein
LGPLFDDSRQRHLLELRMDFFNGFHHPTQGVASDWKLVRPSPASWISTTLEMVRKRFVAETQTVPQQSEMEVAE